MMDKSNNVIEFDPKHVDPETWEWARASVMRSYPRISPQRALQKIRAVYEAILRGESV